MNGANLGLSVTSEALAHLSQVFKKETRTKRWPLKTGSSCCWSIHKSCFRTFIQRSVEVRNKQLLLVFLNILEERAGIASSY